ncbi:energy transducer TonB [Vibrio aquaticus]|uniref:Energy transducer TonB n=1 Tax=Vibrio aquaticus TaxID=2496559 RepID=A0A3S0Q450_9VIBR|nr:energy transducer TonB [Vibrio aquaticus]RTZ18212.1 energy transducer TonB [Vibrio aquaticus]
MNVKRYTIAGSISLAVHAAFLLVAQEPKAFAMPAGAQSTSVSINFKAATSPQPPAVEEHVTHAEPTPEPPKPITPPEPKKSVAKKPAPVNKSIPVKQKPVEQKKIVKTPPKKPPVQQANPKKTEKPVQKPVEKVVKKEPEPVAEEPQLQPANQGASSQPVMVKRPSFLTRPSAPKYPRMARKRGVEGVALYEVWLDEEGDQVKQVLITSSGATALDKSALDAIKQWKFSPHTVGGQKMAHRVQIPVRFKLDR